MNVTITTPHYLAFNFNFTDISYKVVNPYRKYWLKQFMAIKGAL